MLVARLKCKPHSSFLPRCLAWELPEAFLAAEMVRTNLSQLYEQGIGSVLEKMECVSEASKTMLSCVPYWCLKRCSPIPASVQDEMS